MWFGSNGSRSATVGDEFLQVEDNFGEQVGDEACACSHSSAEDAREQAAQVRECLCSVDAPPRIRRDEVVGRQIDPVLEKPCIDAAFVSRDEMGNIRD